MRSQSTELNFKCVCGQGFGSDNYDAIEHVEQIHAGEFNVRHLDATEAAIEARITPSPLDY